MAAKKDITIRQGANFKMVIDYRNADGTPIPLTGYTFAIFIRADNGTQILTEGKATGTTSTVVTRDMANVGRILVNIPHGTSQNWNFDSGIYNILIKDPQDARTRVVEGRVFYSRAAG